MKSWLVGAIVASALAGAASAQVPPELLGGGASGAPMYGEAFYKGAEGYWVLVRERENTGLHCSVNFITPQNTFSLRGPGDADMARKNQGGIWFMSKAISSATKPEIVPILLSSGNDAARPLQAAHVGVPGQGNGALLLSIDVQKSIQEKPDSNEIAIQFEGKEVFRSKLVQLQAAYHALAQCMSAQKK